MIAKSFKDITAGKRGKFYTSSAHEEEKPMQTKPS